MAKGSEKEHFDVNTIINCKKKKGDGLQGGDDDDQRRNFKAFGSFEPVIHYLAGLASGVAGALAGHPLDTVKVRLQTQSQLEQLDARYRGTWHCLFTMFKKEGTRALFKGLSSPLLSLTVINSIAFGTYGNTLKLFNDQRSLTTHLIAGGVAGLAQTIVISPTELLKLRMQVQIEGTKKEYSSPIDCIRKLTRRYGVLHLYRGMQATIFRDIPSYGVWFAAYDRIGRSMSDDDRLESLNANGLLIAGGIAGVLSWLVNYPVDVIKTKFQSDDKFKTYAETVRFTYRTEGYRGFFAGLNSTLIRAFPANAAIFFAAEWTYRFFGKIQDMILERRKRRQQKELRVKVGTCIRKKSTVTESKFRCWPLGCTQA
ncbi:unnamed protein product [Anisakis simplex]|uniref:Mitochondrial carrier protein n=1 Tax=Anisakis simplex TaxID=6269 RepID=A0A0M3K6L0_ANISI|nr:unnamed protein product [Anisakis simplex]